MGNPTLTVPPDAPHMQMLVDDGALITLRDTRDDTFLLDNAERFSKYCETGRGSIASMVNLLCAAAMAHEHPTSGCVFELFFGANPRWTRATARRPFGTAPENMESLETLSRAIIAWHEPRYVMTERFEGCLNADAPPEARMQIWWSAFNSTMTPRQLMSAAAAIGTFFRENLLALPAVFPPWTASDAL